MPHVFCPTDFTVASHAAFQHALSLTLALRGRLTLLHVAEGEPQETSGFPGVRSQLESWGRLPTGSSETAVAGLGMTAEKILGREGDPVEVALHFLDRHPADLIVLSTHQREGRARWLGRAVAEPLARATPALTLFLPQGRGGFVAPADGTIALRRILIPVATHPAPQPAVDATLELLAATNCADATITLFHAGATPDMPALVLPAAAGAQSVSQVARPGDPVEGILAVVSEFKPDLVVMSTAGRHGFLDALLGSTTERVLRRLPCPLLAVPQRPE